MRQVAIFGGSEKREPDEQPNSPCRRVITVVCRGGEFKCEVGLSRS